MATPPRRSADRLTTLFACLSLSFASLVALAAVSTPAEAGRSKCSSASIRFPSGGALERTAARFAVHAPVRILAIGSSSTAGIGASAPSFSYPAQLQGALQERFPGTPVEVVNAGIGGETADMTLARLTRELDRLRPDLVLWQVGTNDALIPTVSEADFETVVERGVAAVAAHGADIVMVDQQFFKKVKDPARYERFVAVVERVARQRRVCLFPRYKIMKDWDRPSAATPAVQAVADAAGDAVQLDAMLSADGFHMNDRGYACVASLLADEIQELVNGAEP
jgi:lysophospholipase L1-like esterase